MRVPLLVALAVAVFVVAGVSGLAGGAGRRGAGRADARLALPPARRADAGKRGSARRRRRSHDCRDRPLAHSANGPRRCRAGAGARRGAGDRLRPPLCRSRARPSGRRSRLGCGAARGGRDRRAVRLHLLARGPGRAAARVRGQVGLPHLSPPRPVPAHRHARAERPDRAGAGDRRCRRGRRPRVGRPQRRRQPALRPNGHRLWRGPVSVAPDRGGAAVPRASARGGRRPGGRGDRDRRSPPRRRPGHAPCCQPLRPTRHLPYRVGGRRARRRGAGRGRWPGASC